MKVMHIRAQDFLNNEKNCRARRNSATLPHAIVLPSPPPLSYQSPEFRASLLFQERERCREREGGGGGGEDKSEAAGQTQAQPLLS